MLCAGRRFAVVAVVLAAVSAFLLVLTACASRHQESLKPETTAAMADPATPLRILSFNIELGGAHVSFDSVINAIESAGADIVAVQEPYGGLPEIAQRLGWYYNLRHHVIVVRPRTRTMPASSPWFYVLLPVPAVG